MRFQTANNVASSAKYFRIIVIYISSTLDAITVKKVQKAVWRRINWNFLIDGLEFVLSAVKLAPENS